MTPTPLEELRDRLAEVADLHRVAVLLAWDQEVVMPREGAAGRADQRATVQRLAHERFVDERVGELLEAAEPEGEGDAALLRVARRDYDKERRVPADLVAELVHAAATGHEAWTRARRASDFAAFEPFLRRNVELRRRYVECFPDVERPYDALLDDFEPYMRTSGAARSRSRPSGDSWPRCSRRSASTRPPGGSTWRPTRSRRRSPPATCA
jgi:carboxypeptidase Taq